MVWGDEAMTVKEAAALERIREELHAYHVEVKQLVAKCESCHAAVAGLSASVYGIPGKEDMNPGLVGEVAELRNSRRLMLMGLRGAWAIITMLLGAGAVAFFR